MSNQLEKLKNSIKKEYTKIFELNLMKTSGFIPVDKRQNDIFVIINKLKLADKTKIENILKEKFSDLTPKFITVEANEFDTLVSNVVGSEAIESVAKPAGEASAEEPTAEDMLVTIGWLTKEQLNECISESKANNETLDFVFHKKGYLSYERIFF